MLIRPVSLLALSLALVAFASCAVEPTPQACVEDDALTTCGCAPPSAEIRSLDPGFHYTSTCSPATITQGTDVGCCAIDQYPLNDQCLCRGNQPPGSCAQIGSDPTDAQLPRSISSCAIDGVLSSS
jgi:hypothetical protein